MFIYFSLACSIFRVYCLTFIVIVAIHILHVVPFLLHEEIAEHMQLDYHWDFFKVHWQVFQPCPFPQMPFQSQLWLSCGVC